MKIQFLGFLPALIILGYYLGITENPRDGEYYDTWYLHIFFRGLLFIVSIAIIFLGFFWGLSGFITN